MTRPRCFVALLVLWAAWAALRIVEGEDALTWT